VRGNLTPAGVRIVVHHADVDLTLSTDGSSFLTIRISPPHPPPLFPEPHFDATVVLSPGSRGVAARKFLAETRRRRRAALTSYLFGAQDQCPPLALGAVTCRLTGMLNEFPKPIAPEPPLGDVPPRNVTVPV
jgi:hypothetical protein